MNNEHLSSDYSCMDIEKQHTKNDEFRDGIFQGNEQ